MAPFKDIRDLIRELTKDGPVKTMTIYDGAIAKDIPPEVARAIVLEMTKAGIIFSPKKGYVEWLD